MIESNEISPFTLFVNKTMGKETPVEKDSVETQSKISLETFLLRASSRNIDDVKKDIETEDKVKKEKRKIKSKPVVQIPIVEAPIALETLVESKDVKSEVVKESPKEEEKTFFNTYHPKHELYAIFNEVTDKPISSFTPLIRFGKKNKEGDYLGSLLFKHRDLTGKKKDVEAAIERRDTFLKEYETVLSKKLTRRYVRKIVMDAINITERNFKSHFQSISSEIFKDEYEQRVFTLHGFIDYHWDKRHAIIESLEKNTFESEKLDEFYKQTHNKYTLFAIYNQILDKDRLQFTKSFDLDNLFKKDGNYFGVSLRECFDLVGKEKAILSSIENRDNFYETNNDQLNNSYLKEDLKTILLMKSTITRKEFHRIFESIDIKPDENEQYVLKDFMDYFWYDRDKILDGQKQFLKDKVESENKKKGLVSIISDEVVDNNIENGIKDLAAIVLDGATQKEIESENKEINSNEYVLTDKDYLDFLKEPHSKTHLLVLQTYFGTLNWSSFFTVLEGQKKYRQGQRYTGLVLTKFTGGTQESIKNALTEYGQFILDNQDELNTILTEKEFYSVIDVHGKKKEEKAKKAVTYEGALIPLNGMSDPLFNPAKFIDKYWEQRDKIIERIKEINSQETYLTQQQLSRAYKIGLPQSQMIISKYNIDSKDDKYLVRDFKSAFVDFKLKEKEETLLEQSRKIKEYNNKKNL
ncbi:hypothetical protein HOK68_00650 [Candidatus Woesearchaeota archaeon]|nr:hypothetical protein [Candidatus Woesearchaeota archaeon]MBT4387081.1 hypothetical protein [Candidatus Woesearchaeota archaeon]MBT4596162.1 hypothetical protein [Candidatus Woesearchaeota archaeon]MBT5741615.1 hypothetical protein [Candidatus Woesearchaeota archaeon]MBT6505269.1 hypothetical protein [Candidatus Woesearchaeota archaeon]